MSELHSFLWQNTVPYCTVFFYPFICLWIPGLFLLYSYCVNNAAINRVYRYLFESLLSILWDTCLGVEFSVIWYYIQPFEELSILLFKNALGVGS